MTISLRLCANNSNKKGTVPTRLQFPTKHRLLTPRDYQQVFKYGRRHKGPFFAFIYCKNELTHARLGLAIAKRHVPLAVDRNRIRRIIRETFRHQQAILGNVDIVIIASTTLFNLSNAALREELNLRWQKLLISLKKSY